MHRGSGRRLDAAALEALAERAEAAWPGLGLSREAFLGDLARAAPAEEGAELHAEDLYLARACAAGLPAALEAFERHFMGAVRAAIRRLRVPPDAAEEMTAALREELFFGRGEAAPKVASYAGRGPLAGWLRVTATRWALRRLRRDRRESTGEDDLLAEVAAADAPAELGHLRRRYEEAFRRAFEESLRALPRRQRTLLRQRFVDGLSGDELAALYRVHRSTVVRWLAKAREALLAGTRERLVARSDVGDSEADTLMRALQSQLDVSLARLLASTGPDEA